MSDGQRTEKQRGIFVFHQNRDLLSELLKDVFDYFVTHFIQFNKLVILKLFFAKLIIVAVRSLLGINLLYIFLEMITKKRFSNKIVKIFYQYSGR